MKYLFSAVLDLKHFYNPTISSFIQSNSNSFLFILKKTLLFPNEHALFK
jgi:hypothetical protein